MPESINIHEPLLVNTIGHSVGVIIFGVLLVLLLSDMSSRKAHVSPLAVFGAVLALVWNLGSLIAMSPWVSDSRISAIAAAVSFGCLSVLPALLFTISLNGQAPILQSIGWVTSLVTVVLHLIEPFTRDLQLHGYALLLIAIVFTALALISVWQVHAGAERRRVLSGVLVPVALILFAGSFVHFGGSHAGHPWPRRSRCTMPACRWPFLSSCRITGS